jgi:hypothetical protein
MIEKILGFISGNLATIIAFLGIIVAFLGTIAGVITGALLGFFAQFIHASRQRKWAKDDEYRKRVREELLKNRLFWEKMGTMFMFSKRRLGTYSEEEHNKIVKEFGELSFEAPRLSADKELKGLIDSFLSLQLDDKTDFGKHIESIRDINDRIDFLYRQTYK